MASTPAMQGVLQLDLTEVKDTAYALSKFTGKISEALLELCAELDEIQVKRRAQSERGLYGTQPCPKCGKTVSFMHEHFDASSDSLRWSCTPFPGSA